MFWQTIFEVMRSVCIICEISKVPGKFWLLYSNSDTQRWVGTLDENKWRNRSSIRYSNKLLDVAEIKSGKSR